MQKINRIFQLTIACVIGFTHINGMHVRETADARQRHSPSPTQFAVDTQPSRPQAEEPEVHGAKVMVQLKIFGAFIRQKLFDLLPAYYNDFKVRE